MRGCVLFDWGDTLMVDFPQYEGPMAAWPHVEAVPGAMDALERVRAAGWCTALATNAADSEESEIRAALARVGLDELVDRVFCSRGTGHAKPSAEFFDYIARDLALPHSQLVMVGDSMVNDVQGANRAGIRAVWLDPGAPPGPGGEQWWVIGELAQLPDVVDRWSGRGQIG